MAYRDDLDGFARRRALDDEEATLLASFHRSQQTNRRRGLALTLAGLLGAVGCLYGWQLATPRTAHAASVRLPRPPDRAAIAEYRCRHALDAYDRRAPTPAWRGRVMVDELVPPCLYELE